MNARSRLNKDQVRREAHEWRDLQTRNALSETEAEAFEAWLAADVRHERAYDRAITVWSAVEHLSADDIDADLMLAHAAERRVGFIERLRSWPGTNGRRLAAVTLCLILMVPLILWYVGERPGGTPGPSQPNPVFYEYKTANGEINTVTLSDGTTATLGAATSLSFADGADARGVVLEHGEVFLEVASDNTKPFSVRANDLVSTVVGTAFEVRYNGGVSRVAVSEGEVTVHFPIKIAGRSTGQHKRLSLTPGLQASAEDERGLGDAQPIPVSDIGAWRDQRLIYDGATLAELLADIQRYSRLSVEIDPALEMGALGKVSASFNSRDIENMAETLPDLFPVSIDRTQPGQLTVGPEPASRP